MTRKDYAAIAATIASVPASDYRSALYQARLINALMATFEDDNSRFDRIRFEAACYEEDPRA
jgi:hypothetical protein